MAFDLSNPFKTAVLKFAEQFLGKRYPQYQEILIRASANFLTLNDAQVFCKMLMEVYEIAYLKAVEECKKQVEGHGLRISIKPSTEMK